MEPTFATAHTFCASCDGPRKLGFLTAVLAKTFRYFACFYNYVEKADLGKGYWNPKRKLGVATHFFSFNLGKNSMHCFVFFFSYMFVIFNGQPTVTKSLGVTLQLS